MDTPIVFEWSVLYRNANRKTWRGGFHSYDEIHAEDVSFVAKYRSVLLFPGAADAILESSGAATLAERD
jgi:hypothetical protein